MLAEQFVTAFRAAFKDTPDLYATDSYGVVYFYKAAVEKAGSTDTAKVRAAMRGLEWDTPQGVKHMRAGDHQAIQDMYPMLRGFISPELLFFQVSGNAVITVVVGGVGTLIGALYGSAIRGLVGDVSILLIEHDVDLVMDLSDHVIVMAQGRKIAEGTAREVRGNRAVQVAYFGEARGADTS